MNVLLPLNCRAFRSEVECNINNQPLWKAAQYVVDKLLLLMTSTSFGKWRGAIDGNGLRTSFTNKVRWRITEWRQCSECSGSGSLLTWPMSFWDTGQPLLPWNGAVLSGCSSPLHWHFPDLVPVLLYIAVNSYLAGRVEEAVRVGQSDRSPAIRCRSMSAIMASEVMRICTSQSWWHVKYSLPISINTRNKHRQQSKVCSLLLHLFAWPSTS